jgi:hypothetical protein
MNGKRCSAIGECATAKHVPGSEPGKRVTVAGSHTANNRRHTPEAGAACLNRALTNPCGGRSAMSVPTAISALNPKLAILKDLLATTATVYPAQEARQSTKHTVSVTPLRIPISAGKGYFGTPCFHWSQWTTTSLMNGAEAAHRLLMAGTKPPELPSGPQPQSECQADSPG